MTPDRPCEPPDTTRLPPAPEMSPVKRSAAAVMVNILPPRTTKAPGPVPPRLTIEAPVVVPEMSNVPSAMTLLDCAMLPVPSRNSVVPVPMVVAPV